MLTEPSSSDASRSSKEHAVTHDQSLVPLLVADRVPMDVLHERYGPLLELVRVLIGVVPNCDPYLEIWPPAFRTYNVMVPNFLNLPFTIFGTGGAPKDLVGLGLYVASRTASCAYCSAHTCSFALRRGASAHAVAGALDSSDTLSPREAATVAVARALASVPCSLTRAERQALGEVLTAEEVEWVVMGITMMGFLNKFMDAVGVELEESTVVEVAQTMGERWSPGKAGTELSPGWRPGAPPSPDSLWTKVRILPRLPRALWLDAGWLRGVPGSWPEVGTFLRSRTGHDFPVLAHVRHKRVLRAIGAMLRDNLDPATSGLGLRCKIIAGVVFATTVENALLEADLRALGPRHGVSDADVEAAQVFARDPDASMSHLEPRQQAAVDLARACSPSPVRVTPAIVEKCRQVGLSAAEVVELVCFVSVLQMLHRLESWFDGS